MKIFSVKMLENGRVPGTKYNTDIRKRANVQISIANPCNLHVQHAGRICDINLG